MIEPARVDVDPNWFKKKGWPAKLMAAYGLSQAALTLWGQGRTWVDAATNYQVSVSSSDPVWDNLHAWMVANTDMKSLRSLSAHTRRKGRTSSVALAYDGSRTQTLDIDGHRVVIRVEDKNGVGPESHMLRPDRKMSFTTRTLAGRDAVLAFISERAAEAAAEDNPPSLWMANSWGWEDRTPLTARPLDSVILKDGQMEGIVADLESFLAHEGDYAHLGQPWHRGYLLKGSPGTGKSALAKALAFRFGWDVYYLNLSDLKGDTNLLKLVASIPPQSLLLLEDIDVASAATSREEGDKRSTLSGLLNALDGVTTPHGLITIMTTNHPERLDPALLRSGRVDKELHLSNLSDEQMRRMVQSAVGDSPTLTDIPELRGALSPAEVADALKASIGRSKLRRYAAVSAIVHKANSDRTPSVGTPTGEPHAPR